MDHNLREMGVGDLSVPREMQRMGEAFYGRTKAYREALGAEDREVLVEAVVWNIYDGKASLRPAARRLAAYIREAVRDLRGQSPAGLSAGQIRLPDPVVIPFVEDKGSVPED